MDILDLLRVELYVNKLTSKLQEFKDCNILTDSYIDFIKLSTYNFVNIFNKKDNYDSIKYFLKNLVLTCFIYIINRTLYEDCNDIILEFTDIKNTQSINIFLQHIYKNEESFNVIIDYFLDLNNLKIKINKINLPLFEDKGTHLNQNELIENRENERRKIQDYKNNLQIPENIKEKIKTDYDNQVKKTGINLNAKGMSDYFLMRYYNMMYIISRESIQEYLNNKKENIFILRRKWRDTVSDMIMQKAECNMTSLFTNMAIMSSLDKASQSNSIIVKADLKNNFIETHNNIILKLSFNSKNKWDNSLEVERLIYTNIVQKLLLNNNTPNIINYIADYKCNLFKQSNSRSDSDSDSDDEEDDNLFNLDKSISKDFLKEVKNILNQGDYHNNQTNILMLEKSNGITIEKWLKQKPKLKNILEVCTQVIYTLKCFTRILLQHNDLHMGNIFIEELPSPISLYYNMESEGKSTQCVELKTKYIAKIFDFDRSSIYHPGIPRNLILDDKTLCDTVGICNSINIKADLFRFLSSVTIIISSWPEDPYKKFQDEFISKISDMNWLEKKLNTPPYNIYLQTRVIDTLFKNPTEAFNILINGEWNEDKFCKIIDNTTIDKVKYLDQIFYPPEEITIRNWNPISYETHSSYRVSENYYFKDDSSRIMDLFLINTNLYFIRWYDELNELQFDWPSKTQELLKLVNKSKPSTKNNVYYLIVCILLTCPILYKVSKEVEREIVQEWASNWKSEISIIRMTISDIWNLFSNVLPVSIPLL